MKKILSIVMCMLMLLNGMCVSADTSSAQHMEKILLSVKSKVEISDRFIEFVSNVNANGAKTVYNFCWTDKDKRETLEISCDEMGRISNYYYYGDNYSNKKISSVTKQQIVDFCEDFLKKTLPEAYNDAADVLVFDTSSYNARGNLRYNLGFKRMKDGVEVNGNYAQLDVYISDDKLYVSNMSAYIDYDTDFEDADEGDFDYISVYKEQFPAELIYRDDYTLYRAGESKQTKLVYRIKDNNIGYIRASDGTVAKPDSNIDQYRFAVENSAASDMASGGASKDKQMLTDAEIAELAVVEKLLPVDKVQSIIKNLPYVDFDSKLELTNVSLTKDESDEYSYRLYYTNTNDKTAKEYRYVNAVAHAHDGTVTYLNIGGGHSINESGELNDTKKADADKKIERFLEAVAGDIVDETELAPVQYTGNNVYHHYIRLVDGIKYIDNGISISFDAGCNKIRNYFMNMHDMIFEDASDAIGKSDAYGKILDYAPIVKKYIKVDDKFVKCYTLSRQYIELDAISGEVIGDDYASTEYEYSDISGHWSENAVQSLAQIQIGIDGDRFEPDAAITQKELLRLFCGGMINKYYIDYTDAQLYENLIDTGIITQAEKAPDAYVTREDAFVYMIRIAGLEKVAKLENIYMVTYADGKDITKGKIGYAAILSGMQIINGSGGCVRPLDIITRAESATMLYKYLLTF